MGNTRSYHSAGSKYDLSRIGLDIFQRQSRRTRSSGRAG